MNECKLTEFGLAVKTELLKKNRSQRWLETEIQARTGMYVDHGYLYRIFTGQRNPEQIVSAIKDILGIGKEGGD